MKDFKLVTGKEVSIRHLVVDNGKGKCKAIADIVTTKDDGVTIENIDSEYRDDIVKLVEETLSK